MPPIARVKSIHQAINALHKDEGGIYIEDDPFRAGLGTRILCGTEEIFDQLRKILSSEDGLRYASNVFVVFVNATVEVAEKILRDALE